MHTQFHTHRPTKTPNLAAACASAEDDFEIEVRSFYEVPTGSISRDLLDMEVIARMTIDYIKGVEGLLNGMTYAADPDRHAFRECLLDLLSDQMQHLGDAVVVAGVARMEAE